MSAITDLCAYSPCNNVGVEPALYPLNTGGALRVWLCPEHAAALKAPVDLLEKLRLSLLNPEVDR